MLACIEHKGKHFRVDLNKPIDLSIPLKKEKIILRLGMPAVKMEPVVMDNWVGEVRQGGSVNFFNIAFNPHGHGTHTECVGHFKENIQSMSVSNNFFHC